MAQQSRNSQQHRNDCHGQTNLVLTTLVGVFSAFFQFFHIHVFILGVSILLKTMRMQRCFARLQVINGGAGT
jgi:hypothetical protein